jgi:predicted transcriptional regulator
MVTRSLLKVDEADALGLAAQMMAWGCTRHLPVMRGDELVGVVSERDILVSREQGGSGRWAERPVREVMSHPPVVTNPDQEIAQASATMTSRRLGCLPVLENGRLVGMLTTTDIMKAASGDLVLERADLQRPVREALQEGAFTLRPDDHLLDAVDLMASRRARHVPVVDETRRLVGVLSDRDVWMTLSEPPHLGQSRLSVGAAMSPKPVSVRTDAPLAVALRQLLSHRVGVLPVVDAADRVVGTVSYLDIIRCLRHE